MNMNMQQSLRQRARWQHWAKALGFAMGVLLGLSACAPVEESAATNTPGPTPRFMVEDDYHLGQKSARTRRCTRAVGRAFAHHEQRPARHQSLWRR